MDKKKAVMMKNDCSWSKALSTYLDEELDEKSRLNLETHVQSCSSCQATLDDLRALHQVFQSLPRPQLGFDLAPAVLAHGGRPRVPAGRVWEFRWWQLLPVSFAAAATVSLGVFIGINLHDRPEPEPGLPTLAMFEPFPPGSVCVGFFAGCYLEKEI